MADSRIAFYGAHATAFQDPSLQLDIEGAVRSGKTTLALAMCLRLVTEHPGIAGLIGRFSDGDTHRLLKPAWRAYCLQAGHQPTWHAEEGYDEFANGSRVYITGLKAQDQTSRYSKFRGLTLAFVYIDQAEELPHDVYRELVLRLSQRDMPHQILITPQTVDLDHWIAKEFPADRAMKPGRAYYALATHDNAHNLPPRYVYEQEQQHPPGTPVHTTLLLGKRGPTIIGDPVYGSPADGSRVGAFVRSRHEQPCDYDPRLTVEAALDFGKHHPCVIARQVSATGQTRYLAGILGHDLNLDPFLTEVVRYFAVWFPNATIAWCCDPAGVNNPIGVDLGALVRGHGVQPRTVQDSNVPTVRVGLIEHIAARMRARDLAGQEALLVAREPERWLRISMHGAVEHRMVASAFESGYVWDKNMVSVGSKQVRRPQKDGWHEHPMNCVEYLEANFGYVRKKAAVDLAETFRQPAEVQSPHGWMGS